MIDSGLRAARAGDESAFRALIEPHRRELHVHCYRMLGSTDDADDLLQETLFAAWRGLHTFAGRSSLRTWLYRIATTRCLNAIRDSRRRPPLAAAPPFEPPTPSSRFEVPWLQPYPDALIEHDSPSARALARELSAVIAPAPARSAACPRASGLSAIDVHPSSSRGR